MGDDGEEEGDGVGHVISESESHHSPPIVGKKVEIVARTTGTQSTSATRNKTEEGASGRHLGRKGTAKAQAKEEEEEGMGENERGSERMRNKTEEGARGRRSGKEKETAKAQAKMEEEEGEGMGENERGSEVTRNKTEGAASGRRRGKETKPAKAQAKMEEEEEEEGMGEQERESEGESMSTRGAGPTIEGSVRKTGEMRAATTTPHNFEKELSATLTTFQGLCRVREPSGV